MRPIYEALGRQRRGRSRPATTTTTAQRKYAADVIYGTNSEFGFDYLRDNMAALARALRPARPPLRGRRRGRQHPHRRGADPADHLRRPRAGRRPLLHVRPPRQADRGRASEGEAQARWARARTPRSRLRLRVRREAQDRRPDRARGRARRRSSSASTTSTLGEHGTLVNHLDPVAEGGVALQARQGLRGHRRRGDDHRRVHRPHPRGPALVGGPPPGDRGEGGRRDPRGEPDPRDDHAPELLPPLRQAQRDDRHGADRGDRVHEDLRDAGGRDPDQRRR